MFYGYPFDQAFFESVSATATVGLSVGITGPTIETGLNIVHILQIWAGRLEMIAWVQLNDDPYALELGPLPEHRTTLGGNSGIGVSLLPRQADSIDWVGGYHARGDVLELRRTYHAAGTHGRGEPSTEAHTIRLVASGQRITHPVSARQVARRPHRALRTWIGLQRRRDTFVQPR